MPPPIPLKIKRRELIDFQFIDAIARVKRASKFAQRETPNSQPLLESALLDLEKICGDRRRQGLWSFNYQKVLDEMRG